ncbi:MAG: DUF6682 family protein [Nitrososphaeraceae archaeon]
MSVINLGEVQTRVQTQFGDKNEAQITLAEITRFANDGQLDLVRRVRCNETTTTTSSVIGTKVYNFTNLLDASRVTYDGRPLTLVDRRKLDQWYPTREVSTTPNGTPLYYFVTAGGIEVYPVPDAAGVVISTTYIKRPVDLVNAGDPLEIPVQYHEDVVRFCLLRAFETDGQWTAADRVGADYKGRTVESRHDEQNKGEESYPSVRALPGDYGEVC